jgi:hypothetical protein
MTEHNPTALKAMRMAAEMRSSLRLIEKSPMLNAAIRKQTRDDCTLYLARTNLIYPPSMRALGLREGQTLAERKQVLRVPFSDYDETDATEEFQDMLGTAARKSLRANWIWRIGQECRQKCMEDWYGFFVTLTVDPKKCPDSQAMWSDGREFRKYIHRLAKVSCKAFGQPSAIKNGASDRDFVHHVGVIEHGKSRHHHHMHVLIWMRAIPESWKKCPNRGVKRPCDRTNDWCRPMSTYWPWALPGIGRAKYFRHEGDMWSRHGFALPYDKKKQRIVRIHAPEKAGLYIAKYMDKDDKVWTHRIKATRNLGLASLKLVLMTMTLSKVEALTWRPRSYNLSTLATTIHTCPSGLLRSLAKQELFVRKWVSKQLDWKTLLQPSEDSFSKMLQSVRDGARPKRMPSATLYEWVSQHLPVPNGYCEKRYIGACVSLGVYFPVTHTQNNEHLGIV